MRSNLLRLWVYRGCFVFNLGLIVTVFFLTLILFWGWQSGISEFEAWNWLLSTLFLLPLISLRSWAIANKNDLLEGEKSNIFASLIKALKSPWISPDNRQRLIDNMKTAWIEGVLEKSLVDDKLLILVGKADPQAVQPPRVERVLHQPHVPDYRLSSSEQIENVYQELGKELLILGAPGSGKTITLLELARSLIKKAEANLKAPIPVVLNLTSWADQGNQRLPFSKWVSERLTLDYLVPEKLVEYWLKDGQLTFLLDGLDEVPGATNNGEGNGDQKNYRDECVQAINDFWQEYNLGNNGIVICSRIEEYQSLNNKLQFNYGDAAILLQPLTFDQARTYIRYLGKNWDGLQQALNNDEILQQFATSPLLLNIMAVSYQDTPASQITGFKNAQDQKNHLFHYYTNRCLTVTTGKRDLPQKQVRVYLFWLALEMVRHRQTVFYIEGLQSSWLQPIQRRWYERGVTLVQMLMAGLIVGLTAGLIGGLSIGLTAGLIFALIAGLYAKTDRAAGGTIAKVQFTEALSLSRPRLPFNWVYVLNPYTGPGLLAAAILVWLIVGSIAGLIFGLIFALRDGLIAGLIGGLTAGLISGPVLILGKWLNSGLSANKVHLKRTPNQGLRFSVRNAIIGGLIAGLIGGLTAGLIFALIAGLRFGGYAVILHGILRSILFRYGCISWNYAKFLDYAAAHYLLRKVGGGYIFRHRMLMEYFAQHEGDITSFSWLF